MLREILQLPGGWSLHGDDEGRPFMLHVDGRSLEPRSFAGEKDSREVYVAIKLEEDKRGRLYRGVENDRDWLTIWKARVVIGITFAEKIGVVEADKLFHEETENMVRQMQRERALNWGG